MTDIGWIQTNGFLTIVYKGKPISFSSKSTEYAKLIKMVKKNDRNGLKEYISSKDRISKYTKGDFTVKGKSVVSRDNKKVPSAIADRIIDFSKNDYSYRALKLFNSNLEKNPNEHSKKQLLNFLERYNTPIMSDGCFLAYKYVSVKGKDLVDSHTGNFINNPGCVVAMDRNKCNSNPKEPCSSGLHVASYGYASSCGSGHEIICVNVNPKDVVSVPEDYDCAKIRTCRYEVVCRGSSEVEKSYVGSQFILSKDKRIKKEVSTFDSVDLYNLSGQKIIDLVYKQTGEKIKLSPKSKKSIIKKAMSIINNHGLKISNEVELAGLSSLEIIKKVKDLTGEQIKVSPKSKKSVISHAIKILKDNNMTVKL